MLPAPFVVVLDANVLFSAPLRDTLLRAAAEGFYQARWSDRLLDELQRSLITKGRKQPAKISHLRREMTRSFPDAAVVDYEPLVSAMQNHVGDRHVAAAAVKCGAQVIVTSNLKHFARLPEGIEAQSPDDFLCNLFDLDPARFIELLREQAASLQKRPMSFEEVLSRLRVVAPDLVALVLAHLDGK
jgi:predicted nucleic acid-binding protein